MSLLTVLLSNGALVLVLMFCLWLLSLKLEDVSIVDIAWGTGFVLIGWLTFALSEGNLTRKVLLAGLTSVWGVRLTIYLAYRNIGQPEDRRYREMRDHHGGRFPLVSLVTVFGAQAIIMWIVSLPLQVGQVISDAPIHWLNSVAVLVWLFGFLFESIGDYQLTRFKSHPENQGRVLDRGLWRYTRHPNYFGDFLVWWGLYGVSVGGWSSSWTVVSPALMSFLLIRVSGVALLERSMKKRSPEYVEYTRRTSAFFPWPPKRSPHHNRS